MGVWFMSNELEILAYMCGVTLFMWLPYILARIIIIGLMPTLKYQLDNSAQPEWAVRAKRAHYNAIENLVPFAGLVIVAHFLDATNDATYAAAIAYFWLRIAHYIVFVSGISFLRTLVFTGCWLAQLCIFFQIIFAM